MLREAKTAPRRKQSPVFFVGIIVALTPIKGPQNSEVGSFPDQGSPGNPTRPIGDY